jgi:hypothetical protein
MINTTGLPASSSSAPATNIHFKMNDRQTNAMILSASGGFRRRIKLVLTGLALNLFMFAILAQTPSPFNLPLYFEANQDQTGFLSRGNGYEFDISATRAQIALRGTAPCQAAVQMQFPGTNPRAEIHGDGELAGKINYLIGDDPAKWQTGLPTFSGVQVAGIYPGINLVYHGNQNQLEYDFDIAPGANPNLVKIHFTGVDKISVTPQGGLSLKIGAGEFFQLAPEIYQVIGGTRKMVMGGYKLLDAHTVAFEIGDYDHSRPLVIDPVLTYSTFFGGNLNTEAWAIALNTNSTAGATNGSIYIAGETLSKQFSTPGVLQTNFGGGLYNGDAFVAKFTNPATNLVYLTYLGGAADDVAFGLAVDADGNAFVTGYTDSTNFPIENASGLFPSISNSYSANFHTYFGHAFVTEVDPNGTDLVYSTYLGGSSSQSGGESIALDSSDNAYVVGYTYSTNFPVTPYAFQTHFGGTNVTTLLNYNAFITEVAPTGLVYSTYLGGTNADVAYAVAVDADNNVYVAGRTASDNFPVWNEPTNLLFRPNHLNGATNYTFDSSFDAFVTKFPPLNGTSSPYTFYSTFLGGTNSDSAYGIAVDSSECAYVTGWTASTNFPVIFPGGGGKTNYPAGLFSYLVTNGVDFFGLTNAFLTKIAADGSAIDYSAVFGGAGDDIGYKVAVDSADNAFVIGSETSTNFPTVNAFGPLSATNSSQFNNQGISDVFVTAFSNNCSGVIYSVLMGGSYTANNLGMSFGYGIALDASDDAFITGETSATNFPTASAPTFSLIGTNFDIGTFLNGTNDAFLAEIVYTPGTPDVLVPPVSQTNGVGAIVSFMVIATNTTPLLYQWQRDGTNVTSFTNLVNGGNISGVSSNVLTITGITTNNQAIYSVIISYGAGTITNFATLTVIPTPFITSTALTNETVGVGSTVTFSLTALGQPPLHYQWSLDGTNVTNSTSITGAKTNILVITDAQTNDSGTYTITITNGYGIYTNDATLTVVPQPIIIVPLTNQTVGLGAPVTFAVTVIGQPPLNYSWQFNGASVTNGSQFSGATTNVLDLTGTTTNNGGTYEVTVTNAFGSTNSSATLTVLTAPVISISAVSNNLANGLNFDVAGGTNGGPFTILTSTNLLTPIDLWSNLGSGTFSDQGELQATIATNHFDPYAPQLFFILQLTNSE